MPAILVVHENRGLNPHIEDIARRLALENFIAVAPDELFTLGGYPGDEDKARDLFAKLDQAKAREDFVAAANYASTIAGGNGKLGAIGFCYGGGMVNFLATRVHLLAGAPFYGAPAPLDQVMAAIDGAKKLTVLNRWPLAPGKSPSGLSMDRAKRRLFSTCHNEMMVIMDAERFGVSQLHQLRGRVGRGSHGGLCLLVTEVPEDSPARERLAAVASTTDGFVLSRIDLSQRREGDVLGTAQAGRKSSLRLLRLLADEALIGQAREEAVDRSAYGVRDLNTRLR